MTDLVPANVDQDAVLRTLGITPNDPATQALLLISAKYGLDPLLKHVVLIPVRFKDSGGNWKQRHEPYISRDGFLHLAHASGVFDGMEVVEEKETPEYFHTTVAVYRRDMRHPFTATGRAKKNDERSKADPYDMALTRAERRALRRAFNVAGVADHEPGEWDEIPELVDAVNAVNGGNGTHSLPTGPTETTETRFEEPPLPDSGAEIASGGGTVDGIAPADVPLPDEAKAVETVQKAFAKPASSNPFIRSIATAAKRAGIDDESLNALVEETTGLRDLNDITEHTQGNKVLEAIAEYRTAKA